MSTVLFMDKVCRDGQNSPRLNIFDRLAGVKHSGNPSIGKYIWRDFPVHVLIAEKSKQATWKMSALP